MMQFSEAAAIAEAVQAQTLSAETLVTQVLAEIERYDARLNCFTTVLAEAALADARQVDQAIAMGRSPGSLAGVPFAVKNLFDIQGQVTLAGAKINQVNLPASQDATAITRLKQAGAILVGALNMDEYAYGFVTVNSHYGATPNPHNLNHMSGGSSGGSAAAVAAGLVPLTLGSDTNGSIRVPASFCGIYGLKPTYGRLSRAGAYPFVASFDHVGPFGRTVRDIAMAYDVMQGPDERDPVCSGRSPDLAVPQLDRGIEGLRFAIADDHFARGLQPEAAAAVQQVAKALQVVQRITLPEAARARAAAYLITASEGSHLHLPRLRDRLMDFDPATRDRFVAGAMIPASWYLQAQRFRHWYRDRVRAIFQTVDVILAPTTPGVAPPLDQKTLTIDGQEVPLRPNVGLYTQPLSFIGLPIISVPIWLPETLPIGVQLIAAPYQETTLLRVAAYLEAAGVTTAPIAPLAALPA
ncbi:AtzE family amidohydrolase [Almyronema epifaneia]|uniref:AtzE family amidohydrolase n=1 Tax=Almyronema epifaneia S1 TaxID=2991925 RepID=A0ABW6I9R4_9CYAN